MPGSCTSAIRNSGVLGQSGTIGEGFLIATGATLSAKLRGTDQVTVNFSGDGRRTAGRSIAWGRMVGRALEAAEQAAKDGIDVEVLDPRGLRPLDVDAIVATVEKTGRVILTHEAPKTGGGASEVAAIIAEEALTTLDAPLRRVCGVDTPIPQSVHLEQYAIPSTADIALAIKEVTS